MRSFFIVSHGHTPMSSLRGALIGLLLIAPHTGIAQTTTEVWPELDIYWNATSRWRTVLETSLATEREGSKREATVGIFEDYLRRPAGYLRAGFRYTFSTADASYRESRLVGDVVVRPYGTERMRLLNRTRGELRWVNGEFSYRVRDRLHLQRLSSAASGPAWSPYGTIEAYYDSRFASIPRLGGRIGTELRLAGPASLDIYIARQHDTRPAERDVYALGLTTRLTY